MVETGSICSGETDHSRTNPLLTTLQRTEGVFGGLRDEDGEIEGDLDVWKGGGGSAE